MPLKASNENKNNSWTPLKHTRVMSALIRGKKLNCNVRDAISCVIQCSVQLKPCVCLLLCFFFSAWFTHFTYQLDYLPCSHALTYFKEKNLHSQGSCQFSSHKKLGKISNFPLKYINPYTNFISIRVHSELN